MSGEIVKKHCKLKNVDVFVEIEKVYEQGREGIVRKPFMKNCLNKDEVCEDLDCRFVRKGIGGSGKNKPFD
ncbi:MAG: hypothetical protein ABH844_01510 [Candidatus Omnitrophota bacterium]